MLHLVRRVTSLVKVGSLVIKQKLQGQPCQIANQKMSDCFRPLSFGKKLPIVTF